MADLGDSDQGTRLQFERAEYSEGVVESQAASVLRCSSCRSELSYEYFEVNGQPICERCRFEFERALDAGSSAGRLLGAVAGGLIAAALGAGIYYAVLALTGYEVGLIAIVVGFLVGAGVRWGSRARGGWPYQTIAAGLTYVAIVSTYIPLMMAPPPGEQSQPTQPPTPAGPGESSSAPSVGGREPGESVEEFTQRITTDLRLLNPRAADAFTEGNAARDSQDLPRAERLYREVLQLQPRFGHARRRLCDVLAREDRRDEAVPLCRQAVQDDPSVFNVAELVFALSAPSHGLPAPPADRAEAMSQANLLLNRSDLDDTTVTMLCMSAANADAYEIVRRCSARLDQLAPLSLSSAHCGFVAAMSVGNFDQADVRLTQARKAGLDDKAYQELAAVVTRARAGPAWTERLLNMARLLLVAAALPFLLGVRNIIGIAIIGFGAFQAWRMNRRVSWQFGGPYRVGAIEPAPTRDTGDDAV